MCVITRVSSAGVKRNRDIERGSDMCGRAQRADLRTLRVQRTGGAYPRSVTSVRDLLATLTRIDPAQLAHVAAEDDRTARAATQADRWSLYRARILARTAAPRLQIIRAPNLIGSARVAAPNGPRANDHPVVRRLAFKLIARHRIRHVGIRMWHIGVRRGPGVRRERVGLLGIPSPSIRRSSA